METKADSILESIADLSVADLLTLQEHITALLRQKTTNSNSNGLDVVNGNGHKPETKAVNNGTIASDEDEEPDRIYPFPGSPIYRLTKKGIAKLFTPEELERLKNFDPNTLPEPPISLSQAINEDAGNWGE